MQIIRYHKLFKFRLSAIDGLYNFTLLTNAFSLRFVADFDSEDVITLDYFNHYAPQTANHSLQTD